MPSCPHSHAISGLGIRRCTCWESRSSARAPAPAKHLKGLLPRRPHAPGGPSPSHRVRRDHNLRLSHTALAFQGNLGFFTNSTRVLAARIVISFLFCLTISVGEIFTAYESSARRFGERLRSLTALTFLVTRSLAEGGSACSPSQSFISIILGTGEVASIVLIVGLTVCLF